MQLETLEEKQTLCWEVRAEQARQCGAIGKFYPMRFQFFAADEAGAILAFAEHYERTGPPPEVKQVQSPFDSQALVRLLMSDPDLHASVQRHVSGIVRALDHARTKANKAHRDWHDDKEHETHWLYQAPEEAQYSGQDVLLAAAECALYFMRETPAGLKICDQLTLQEKETV